MFEQLLVHRVEVYHRQVRRDRLGQQVDVNPSLRSGPPDAVYACRAYQKSGGLAMQERSVDVFERRYMVHTGLDAEISETDAVRVVGAGGEEIVQLSKVFSGETKYDGRGPHHKEFILFNQGGPLS